MKRTVSFALIPTALALLLAGGQTLQAEFLQPTAVQVSNGAATQDALINGFGLSEPGLGSPAATHSRDAAEMWSGVGSIRESAILDLGQEVTLTKVYIWNYNVAGQTDVGMKDVEVQVSSATDLTDPNAVFNGIARLSLLEGGEAAQAFDVVGTHVRLVKLKGLSNWGQGYTVGLAEARFESGSVTGNVPSIVLNSPREGDEIAFGTDIIVDARITDLDGTADLQKVELFDGDTLITIRTVTTFTASIKGAAKGDHALRVVATDKSGKASWVTVNVFVRELVADRIVKIDDTADEGTETNQIRYVTGTWNLAQGEPSDPRYNHNDHYNLGTTRTDYFEVRFYGVKIDLFATVASHHGTGMASIDGGPESKVTYRAAQRAEQVFVWGSPILANREHVLKVRTVGDGVVTADRFDVSVSDTPEVTTATLRELAATTTNLIVTLEDAPSSVVNPGTVQLKLDAVPVAASVTKAAPITTINYTPAVPFEVGSTHAVTVLATDQSGTVITNEATFTLPAPFFPLTGLGGPKSIAGAWGLRQIWGGGRADAVVSAVDISRAADAPGFAGQVADTTAPVINFGLSSDPGGGGLLLDDQPLPAEPALATEDFVVIGHARVVIPRSGDWTIGVQTDDGFALRWVGAPFESVSGTGVRDDNFPEYMASPNAGAASMRGVLQGIAAGQYDVEWIAFQRSGSAYFEVYAAEGAFVENLDTDQWQLIGAPGGLEVVVGIDPEFKLVTKTGNTVVLELESPQPAAAHQLQGSADLQSWQPVAAATFSQVNATRVRATINNVTSAVQFYRVAVSGP